MNRTLNHRKLVYNQKTPTTIAATEQQLIMPR